MSLQKSDALELMGSAVEFSRVSKTIGTNTIVNDVSLSIRSGEFVTLLGPSGCGKTTLLNMIAGFVLPDQGVVRIGGVDVSDVPVHMRDTGMLFQSYALFPHMNVFDNIAFGLKQRKLPSAEIRKKVMQTVEMTKLTGLEQRRVSQLSGGQRQRVALARAIAIEPKVLLLDEPLSALDKNLRTQMQVELIELHRKTGLTTIFVTHDQAEALSLSDRIVVMNRGEIQQVASPIDLYRNPANGFVASFIGEINALPPATYIRDEKARLRIGTTTLTAQPRQNWSFDSNSTVRAFVRPENVKILAPGDDHENILVGTITSHIYQGSHTITRLHVDGIGRIEMLLPGGDLIGKLPVGGSAKIIIDLSEAIILPEAASRAA